MAAGFGCGSTYSMLQKDKLTFFYLKQPDAKQVIFICSLDGFDPHPAEQINNIWVVKIPSDKSFQFYYLVDGEIFLPPCKNREMDDFGGENCIFNP